jgi:hypothetical protein
MAYSSSSAKVHTSLLAMLDTFQARQIVRRAELDLTTELPRVLGDIVMAY